MLLEDRVSDSVERPRLRTLRIRSLESNLEYSLRQVPLRSYNREDRCGTKDLAVIRVVERTLV